jgi:hypothetical protein
MGFRSVASRNGITASRAVGPAFESRSGRTFSFGRTGEENRRCEPQPSPRERNGRAASRGGGEVIELEFGITVYPAQSVGERWRAVWYESDERQQDEAATEEKLAVKLERSRSGWKPTRRT